MDEVEHLREFRCPLCKSEQALIVFIPRKTGDAYRTPFYSCAGCTVMFLNVQRFSRQVSSQRNERGWLVDYPELPKAGAMRFKPTDD